MTPISLLDKIHKHLQDYRPEAIASIRRNSHMNEITADTQIEQKVVDAILVDFINFVGMQYCVDYAMYTCDLKQPVPNETV